MDILSKAIRFIGDPEYRFNISSYYGLLNHMSDERYIRRQYKFKTGRDLNLENPTTFNEKLQWLKLNYRKDLFTVMVDKIAVKDYLKSVIGCVHIVPIIGKWGKFDEIDFSTLPNQFVLKTNHGCGGIYICRDKKKMKVDEAREAIGDSLRHNYYYSSREWPYKNVKPMIFAEKYSYFAY